MQQHVTYEITTREKDGTTRTVAAGGMSEQVAAMSAAGHVLAADSRGATVVSVRDTTARS